MADPLSYAVPDGRARRVRGLADQLRARADAADAEHAARAAANTAADAERRGEPAPKPKPRPVVNVIVHGADASRDTPPLPTPRSVPLAQVAGDYQRLKAAGIDARLVDSGRGVDVPEDQAARAAEILDGRR